MSTTFSYVGSNVDFQVPERVTSITVFLWGAGGGQGVQTPSQEFGGAGAYVTGTLAVTPGSTLSILVGGGGKNSYAGGTGGYGGGGSSAQQAGGGGRSAIQQTFLNAISSAVGASSSVTYTTSTGHGLVVGQPVIITGLTPAGYNGTFIITSAPTTTTFTVSNSTTGTSSGTGTIVAELVDAGGGGGGAGWAAAAGGAAAWTGTASNGTSPSGGVNGLGASQTAGGAAVAGTQGQSYAGTALLGGAQTYQAGGGGGGYYGGGSGAGNAYNHGGGGGGSSYTALLTGASGANGTGATAPGTAVVGYVSGVAVGGSASPGTSAGTGGNGLVIIVLPPTCFTAESNLLTPTGYKSAKDIKTGDLLMTADGRKVPVKAYRATVMGTQMTAPFLMKKDALGMGCPKADLRLSPWHAIQMNNGLWMKPQSFSELYPGSVQQYGLGKPVTYYHFEAPNFFKDNLICDGTVVESYGGDQLDNVKGRVYNYDSKLKAYTRISGKPAVAKKLMM